MVLLLLQVHNVSFVTTSKRAAGLPFKYTHPDVFNVEMLSHSERAHALQLDDLSRRAAAATNGGSQPAGAQGARLKKMVSDLVEDAPAREAHALYPVVAPATVTLDSNLRPLATEPIGITRTCKEIVIGVLCSSWRYDDLFPTRVR